MAPSLAPQTSTTGDSRHQPAVFKGSLLVALACMALNAGSTYAGEASTAMAERIPTFHAEYAVKYGILTIGRSTLQLQYPRPSTYRYQMFVAPQGIAKLALGTDYTDTSTGRINDSGELLPEYFLHERTGREETANKIIFDRRAGTIRFGGGNTIELQPDYVDRLLPQLLIMRDFLRTEHVQLSYSIVEDGKVKEYTFIRMGREQIEVPAGKFEAQRIQLQRGNKDKESNAWLDPQRHNLPLRIEHTAGGQTLLMELKSVAGELSSP